MHFVSLLRQQLKQMLASGKNTITLIMGIWWVIGIDFLEYLCLLRADRRLHCSFTQALLWNGKEIFGPNEKDVISRNFVTTKAMNAPKLATKNNDLDARISSLEDGQKSDIVVLESAHLKACSAPTDENILAYFELSNRLAASKCTITVNLFEHDFELSTTGNWQTTTNAGGICGAIGVARFEHESGILGNISQWKYIQISIQVQMIHFLQPATKTDEKEYQYSSKYQFSRTAVT